MTKAIYRVFMRWAKSAALKHFEENLPESQVGSRPGRSPYLATMALQAKVSRMVHDRGKAHLALLDVKNAFSSLPIPLLIETVRIIGVAQNIVNLLARSLYSGSTTIKGTGEKFRPSSGVKQGCPMAGFVFTAVYSILQKELENEGIFHVAFVDDIAIVAESWKRLQHSMDVAQRTLHRLGLQLNVKKTEIAVLGVT